MLPACHLSIEKNLGTVIRETLEESRLVSQASEEAFAFGTRSLNNSINKPRRF